MFKIAVICGGPSLERGISLNSARSLLDHLQSPLVEIIPLFVDYQRNFYLISPAQLYSNTPSDFVFKLHRIRKGKEEGKALSMKDLRSFLKSVDLIFPVIHGVFGEDGELQELLESFQVPFVGQSSTCCRQIFPKYQAATLMRHHGFATLPQLHLANPLDETIEGKVSQFFKAHHLQRAIVKPNVGGSSIGVSSVSTPQEACVKIREICPAQSSETIVEPFCEGIEFTVVVLSNPDGNPVALIPTEIELDYAHHQIFDYRRKYLPTNLAAYYTPPRFSPLIVENIRHQAEQLFTLFGMQDFVRMDGWLGKNGGLYFTDINPISGMEQNSFLFRQSSLLGLTHRQTLEYIVRAACKRYGLHFPVRGEVATLAKKPVYVIFGSHNAERQVSLMSGTNVWLKLLESEYYAPEPFLLDQQGNVWQLPYSYPLNHTVEEVYSNCVVRHEAEDHWQQLLANICEHLKIPYRKQKDPTKMLLHDFLDKAKKEQAFVFLGLHGGKGEDGTLQKALEERQLKFNGSNSTSSSLCMDKLATGEAIQRLNDTYLQSSPKINVVLSQLLNYGAEALTHIWKEYCQFLQSERLIIKPRFDGCSAGIVSLSSSEDLLLYCQLISQRVAYIPPYTFLNQQYPIEMPSSLDGEYLLEPYIETDTIVALQGSLEYTPKQGWIELTVGILEQNGIYHALNPSITIAEGGILTLEEKFQGGTGINLTPPPEEILFNLAITKIKELVVKASKALGLQNYARLDLFYNRYTEKMILIEANSLPGLTPSTVIYHQGLAEEPPLTPLKLLETIINAKMQRLTGG